MTNTRVFITGAGSGLGRALALRSVARSRAKGHDASVFVSDIDAARADETAHLVEGAGARAVARALDVRDADAFEAAAAAAVAEFGGVDLVVNNAGVAGAGAIGEAALDDWRFLVDVNMWGPIHGCHVFAPRLKAQGHGGVLNVASAAAFATGAEMGAYNTTKAAVVALSETLYSELRPHGVHAGVLCPSFFPTRLLEDFRAPSMRLKGFAEKMFARSKFSADDVADAALAGMAKGHLHIVPMPDARAVWRLKRAAPQMFLNNTVRLRARAERFLQKK